MANKHIRTTNVLKFAHTQRAYNKSVLNIALLEHFLDVLSVAAPSKYFIELSLK